MKKLTLLILVFSLAMLSFSQDSEARRRRRHRAKRMKIINERKLFERIGGTKTIAEIVDEWTRLNLADTRVAPSFAAVTAKPEKLARMRKNLSEQLCEIADGPCQYKGIETKKAHEGLALTDDQFLIVSDNLVKSLQKFGIAEREKNELLARVGEVKAEILQ